MGGYEREVREGVCGIVWKECGRVCERGCEWVSGCGRVCEGNVGGCEREVWEGVCGIVWKESGSV